MALSRIRRAQRPLARRPEWARAAALLLPLAAAEAGVRLLSPRPRIAPAPPVPVTDHFEPADIDRGARFARKQLALGLLGEAVRAGALAALAARRRRVRPRRDPEPLGVSALAAANLAGVLLLARLPLAAVARRRSLAVGLATQSWRGWALDVAKAGAITEVVAAAAGVGVSATIRRWPERWWLVAAAGSVGATAAAGLLGPVVLEPLFNDFEPLADGEMRRAVLRLANQAGVEVGEVYTVDASRRTTGANAYVGGLGPTKRVVLFDTLLDRFTPQEVVLVVAHELSHVRHRDVLRSLGFAALVAPAAALAVRSVLPPLAGRADELPVLGLAALLVLPGPSLVGARLSRAIERRADRESLELSGDPRAFISLHRRIAVANVADLTPPWWARLLLASHPPTAERIAAGAAFAG